jgi:hypothetical protein
MIFGAIFATALLCAFKKRNYARFGRAAWFGVWLSEEGRPWYLARLPFERSGIAVVALANAEAFTAHAATIRCLFSDLVCAFPRLV